jgi:hypothetical protein
MYVYIYIYVCMYVSVCMYTYVCMYVYVYMIDIHGLYVNTMPLYIRDCSTCGTQPVSMDAKEQ